ncbi:hypothetical protein [Mucilaginibacter jinjuensis]|uniref:YcxB-like protein n=1 Tax=Mucilaginibacter jinjuensis TaxID=1176721 RepID=A0ABY7TD18_9SPHI|nr:hypothetical protein [Mucilaginibacter jinjuensis]WCT13087.1 hypothetical protein PQO05_03955 [Mucilaginibacter jinjuensis]
MKIIYTAEPISFYKRLWQSVKTRLLLALVFFIFLVAGMWQTHFFGIAIIIFFFCVFLVFPFLNSFKWTKRQIIKVEADDDMFRIHLLLKDEPQTVTISKKELQMKLKWLGGREHILNLTFFKNDLKVFEIFSYGDGKKSEYEVEDIRFQINQHIGYNVG